MAKTGAERNREYLVRKRKYARECGLCYTCRKAEPKAGRSICTACNAAALSRKKRKRKRDREAVQFQQVIAVQERAGDMASTYHLYADATHYYQEALNVPLIALTDRERIAEKIGQAFFLSGDLRAANLWFERLLMMYRSNPKEAVKSVEALFQLHRQLILNCKADAAKTMIMRAAQIADISGDAHLAKLMQLRIADFLQVIGRFDEAAKVLREVDRISEEDDALRGYYLVAQGWAAGAVGDAEKAYENFESAVELTKEDPDPYRVAIVWGRYAYIAHELGDSARAKACCEQALFVAQQYRITVLSAELRLFYARLLACMGQPATAHLYLLEMLSSSTLIPLLDVRRNQVGILLALQVQDQTALAQCAHTKGIELAFQSEIPEMIGGVTHAFAQLYASQGRPRAARALLHRALEKISYAHSNLDVLIAVAQHGALADIPRARALLEARTALPHATVFHAGLNLFDAFVEQRRGSLVRARMHAHDAIACFDALQWHGYAKLACSIIPGADDMATQRPAETTLLSHMQPALTAREREVAALVLRGFTNREIANELIIALHTVEKHMNSIMNRLGVRSRYQVAGLLDPSE